jgi:hypothetical protein
LWKTRAGRKTVGLADHTGLGPIVLAQDLSDAGIGSGRVRARAREIGIPICRPGRHLHRAAHPRARCGPARLGVFSCFFLFSFSFLFSVFFFSVFFFTVSFFSRFILCFKIIFENYKF